MQGSILEKLKQPLRWVRSWMWVLYNGYPAKRLYVIGVTGTDGKTTTAMLIYEMLKAAGKSVGVITTVGIKYYVNSKFQEPSTKQIPNSPAIAGLRQGGSKNQISNEVSIENGLHVTNPDARIVQGLFKKMADAGVKYVIVETTSHRLAQLKTVGYNVQIGVLTNLTREHLDYHGTMENYAAAKARLIKKAPYVVLNQDDEWFEYFKSKIQNPKNQKVINFSKSEIQNKDISPSLAGEYNKYNIGAAVAVVGILGVDRRSSEQVIKEFKGVPGRREEVPNTMGIRMVVDFAHTPNALKQLLTSLRAETKGKIILVFGCTGERDTGKRPEMGQVAEKYADEVIVTADDPRSEDLGTIFEQIVSGIPPANLPPRLGGRNKERGTVIREDDRDKAISLAVKMAKKGDIVVASGMGPEPTILIKGKEIQRSDRAAFEKAISC